MSQIAHLLVLRLADYLQQEMIDNCYDSNTRANVVSAYRFQDDLLKNPINLAVLSGDPEDPNFMDGRIGYKDMADLGLNIPSGEIGGGHLWWRRGRVKIGCYFVEGTIEQVDAADYAHTVLGRAMSCLEECPVSDLVDDYGEHALQIVVTSNTFSEGGGPENQYIWRGMIHWQALTERPI